MNGGAYECSGCGYRIAHFTSDEAEKRMACPSCEGWMYPDEQMRQCPNGHNAYTVGDPYLTCGVCGAFMVTRVEFREPNLFWRFVWWCIKPLAQWADRHSPDEDDDI